jgi:hypothetical protein
MLRLRADFSSIRISENSQVTSDSHLDLQVGSAINKDRQGSELDRTGLGRYSNLESMRAL